MADNTTYTPGTGETLALDDVGGVKYQRVKVGFGPDGTYTGDVSVDNPLPIVEKTRSTYVVQTTNQTLLAVANTVHADLFNATGSGIKLRVTDIIALPIFAGAVTGVQVQWDITRTSSVGTGGSVLTPQKFDSTFTSLPVGITARGKPTGGAATSSTLISPNFNFEETANITWQNMVGFGTNWLPRPVVLNEAEGLKIIQVTSSAVGSINFVFIFERVT